MERSLRGSSLHPLDGTSSEGFPTDPGEVGCLPSVPQIRAARQAAAVEVEVGLAPFIHMVSCCFRLVMIAPGAWLKTCLSSWCYSGPEEAASLLRQLTVKGTEAVWKWVEEEAVVCKVIMSHLTDFVKEFFTLTFLCKSDSATTQKGGTWWRCPDVVGVLISVVRSHVWDKHPPALFIGRCRVKKFPVCRDTAMCPSDSSTSPRLSKLNQMEPFSYKTFTPFYV